MPFTLGADVAPSVFVEVVFLETALYFNTLLYDVASAANACGAAGLLPGFALSHNAIPPQARAHRHVAHCGCQLGLAKSHLICRSLFGF